MKSSSLHLAKENFKFSSAHFLIFDDVSAEMLHGHNYQVKVDLQFSETNEKQSGQTGYAVDFNILKKFIKTYLDLWDEHLLMPRLHKDVKSVLSSNQKNYEITFRDRFYSIPKDEVIWLDIDNTSVEHLSSVLAEIFFKEFKKYGLLSLTVFVEETRGQSASTTMT